MWMHTGENLQQHAKEFLADLAGGVDAELVEGVVDGSLLLSLRCPAVQVDSNVL